MTQDYARRKPRKRKKSASKKKKSTLPPWLWLATGLCIGLLAGLLFHLARVPADAVIASESAPATKAQAAPEEDVEFTFYTLLPKREVMVSSERQASTAATAPAQQPSTRTTEVDPGFRYYLQAGSFQKREDAEKRRVQLLLLDMQADIEKIRHQGKSWYRVQAGPYQSTRKIAALRNTLGNEGIDTLVTKRQLN